MKEEAGILKSNQRAISHFRAAQRYMTHSHAEVQHFKTVPEISHVSAFCNCLQKLERSHKKKLGEQKRQRNHI